MHRVLWRAIVGSWDKEQLPRVNSRINFAAALLLAAALGPSIAAEPVKRILIFVEPFYSARTPDEAPKVGTGGLHADLLASQQREDILMARDMIVAKPQAVTPMTMMVLAIRLYDVGLRDDAVFWFYVSKDRFQTLTEVAVPNAPLLETAATAMRDFNALAGPIINGYAFCNLAMQQATRTKAIAWVEANPYEAIFNDRLPARTINRVMALAEAIKTVKANAAEERAYFDDARNASQFAAARKKNEADVKYCWR
jgi:hypothetical protein